MKTDFFLAVRHIMNGLSFKPRLLVDTPWTGHIPFLATIFSAQRPRSYVELGVHKGASFLAACQAAAVFAPDCICSGIDTWEGDDHAVYSDGDQLYKNLKNTTSKVHNRSHLIRSLFEEAVLQFPDASIDILHIDGLHTYDAVKKDYETWLPKMSDRGVMLFHDTCVTERGFGVHRFWSELKDTRPSINFHHSNGLGVLLVGTRQPDAVGFLTELLQDDHLRGDFEKHASKSVDDYALGLSSIRQSLPKLKFSLPWNTVRFFLRAGSDFRKLDRGLTKIARADEAQLERSSH